MPLLLIELLLQIQTKRNIPSFFSPSRIKLAPHNRLHAHSIISLSCDTRQFQVLINIHTSGSVHSPKHWEIHLTRVLAEQYILTQCETNTAIFPIRTKKYTAIKNNFLLQANHISYQLLSPIFWAKKYATDLHLTSQPAATRKRYRSTAVRYNASSTPIHKRSKTPRSDGIARISIIPNTATKYCGCSASHRLAGPHAQVCMCHRLRSVRRRDVENFEKICPSRRAEPNFRPGRWSEQYNSHLSSTNFTQILTFCFLAAHITKQTSVERRTDGRKKQNKQLPHHANTLSREQKMDTSYHHLLPLMLYR